MNTTTTFKLNIKPKTPTVVEASTETPAKPTVYILSDDAEIAALREKVGDNNTAFMNMKTGMTVAFTKEGQVVLADANARKATDAFIKVLAVIALKRRRVKVKALENSYAKYLSEAAAFVKKHKVKSAEFMKMANKLSVLKGETEMADGTKLSDRVAEFLKDFRPLYRNSIKSDMDSVSIAQYQILNALLTLLSTPSSSNAYKAISKYVVALKDPALIPFFTLSEDDTGGDAAKLLSQRKELLKKLGGNEKEGLTTEKKLAAAKKNPDAVRAYTALNANILNRYKHDVRKIVFDAKKPWLFLEQVVPALKKLGWPASHMEKYYSTTLLETKKTIGINQNAELTDKFGSSIGVTSLPPDKAKVFVNDTYGTDEQKANYVFRVQSTKQATEGKGESAKYMTLDWNASKKTAKWEGIDKLLSSDNLEKAKAKWRAGFKSPDNAVKTYAYLAETLYWTAGRVSARDGASDGKTTSGISSLKAANIKVVSPTKLKISYKGKAAQNQVHYLDLAGLKEVSTKDKAALTELIKYLTLQKKRTNADKFIFTVNTKRVNTNNLAKWLRKVTGIPDFKNHAFRYLRGTEIATRELDAVTKKAVALKKSGKLNLKTANALFKEAITPVAVGLGHFLNEKPNVNTSIKSYIKPTLMIDWYKNLGLIAPTPVRNALKMMNKE